MSFVTEKGTAQLAPGCEAGRTCEKYPEVAAYQSGTLPEEDGHQVYYACYGNPEGKPVIYVHGGPGGGTTPGDAGYFDLEKWHVILFDQRGCGKSTPHAVIESNTTAHLISDMERIREVLGIEKWVLFGGSWGSTLSLAYADKHPERTAGLVLRGIFTLRAQELRFYYEQGGAQMIFPDVFDYYQAIIPEEERGDLMGAYAKRLAGEFGEETQLEAAKRWSVWEGTTSKLIVDPSRAEAFSDPHFALSFARIENHYFMHGGFFGQDDYLLANAHKLEEARIPGAIVQGRYDVVCPAATAWELHKAWPSANFTMVPDAGHSANEPGITAQLMQEVESMYERAQW